MMIGSSVGTDRHDSSGSGRYWFSPRELQPQRAWVVPTRQHALPTSTRATATPIGTSVIQLLKHMEELHYSI
jgi:hypothetical protein